MRRGEEMVLLVADYFRRGDGTIRLRMRLRGPAAIVDLLSNRKLIDRLPPGERVVPIPLGGERARLLYVRPLTADRSSGG